jgi:hypothetical protein
MTTKSKKITIDRSTLEKLQQVAEQIMFETVCPDPGEGGCIGGPIEGFGCVHEASRYLYKSMDRILREDAR